MKIEIDIADVLERVDADDILDFVPDEVLDEVTAKHVEAHWETKITASGTAEFIDLLTYFFDDIRKECTPQQLDRIKEVVNGTN